MSVPVFLQVAGLTTCVNQVIGGGKGETGGREQQEMREGRGTGETGGDSWEIEVLGLSEDDVLPSRSPPDPVLTSPFSVHCATSSISTPVQTPP